MPAGNPGGYSPAQKAVIGRRGMMNLYGSAGGYYAGGRTETGPTLVPPTPNKIASRSTRAPAVAAAAMPPAAASPSGYGANVRVKNRVLAANSSISLRGRTPVFRRGGSDARTPVRASYTAPAAATSAAVKRAATRGLPRTGSIGMGAAATMGAMGLVGGSAGAYVTEGDVIGGAMAGAAGAAASVLAFTKGGGAIRSAAKMAFSAGAIGGGTARMGVRAGQALNRMSGGTAARGAAATAGAGLSGMMFSGSRSDKNHGFNRSRGNRIGG